MRAIRRYNTQTCKMIKWITVLIWLFIFKTSGAQQPPSNCKVLTSYGTDGRAIKYIAPQTIDSTATEKSMISVQTTPTYSYINITSLSSTGAKKLEGDLVVRFADNSAINVPLSTCNNVTIKNVAGFTCTYIILDKYISALQTKVVTHVVYRMNDNTFKAIDMKVYSSLLKNAIICLAPVVY